MVCSSDYIIHAPSKMKDGDIGDGSADGPGKFFDIKYCDFCKSERLIDKGSHRCQECNRIYEAQ
jgi:hypothetical protein